MRANASLASPAQATVQTERATVVISALFAALLGVFVTWGVGFSHIAALHNAGHDTRHSNAFPCH